MDGGELFGTVIKLNPQRAKIHPGIWGVPYTMLFTIIDGKQGRDPFVPAELEQFSENGMNAMSDDGNIDLPFT